MIGYPGAKLMPTAHFWGGHGGAVPRWIIVHGTAGFTTAEQVGAYFQTNDPATSVHYVVGRDGTIVQCVDERDSAWGNGILSSGHAPWWPSVSPDGNPNWVTFSIEHVKPALDNSDVLTPAQQAASFALIAHLCDTYGIPRRAADASGGITGHFSIDPVNRARCPGPYPWDALYSYLATGGTPHMSYTKQADGWWKDDTTGREIGQGIYDYVSAHGITQPCILGEESYAPGSGDTVAIFGDNNNDRCVVWDSTHSACTESWSGHVAIEYRARLLAAEAQIAALKQQLATPPAPTPTPTPTSTPLSVPQAVAELVTAIAAELKVPVPAK